MAPFADRRGFCAALLAAALASPALAAAPAPGLDGTWGAAKDGLTAQLIITGRSLIGFYWRGDYIDTDEPVFAADGQSLTFAFAGGTARLTRTGDRTARLDVTEGAAVTHMDLRKD